MSKEKISFVIPCYNSTNTLDDVVAQISCVMEEKLKEYDYEIILTNDCSPDGTTYDKIKEIAEENKRVKGINLARNFGQPSAVMSALNYAKGDYIVCGDDDGQTPFSELPRFMEKIRAGYDVVEAKFAHTEKKSLFRKFGTFMNESMATWLISKPKGISLTTFWMIRKFVKDEMIKYPNSYPYLGGLMMRVSQKVCNVEVNKNKRLRGKSGYSLKKMINLWLNGFTSFSIKPLRLATILGFVMAFIGFVFGLFIVVRKILNPNILAGYSSLLAIMLFLFGFCFIFMGLMGEYIGRVYMSLNKAPQFIIRETVNTDDEKN